MISARCWRSRGPRPGVTVARMRFEEYRSHDALGLAGLVRDRQITAGELLDLALQQAAATDDRIAALVYLQVDRARRAIADGLPDGSFTGVPFLIKDLGCEAVDFPTCMGSALYRDYRYSVDSELFTRLERAGLVTFARTTSPSLESARRVRQRSMAGRLATRGTSTMSPEGRRRVQRLPSPPGSCPLLTAATVADPCASRPRRAVCSGSSPPAPGFPTARWPAKVGQAWPSTGS